ncbi:T9SS type A sorting domain-containing protein [Mangrovivirga sp. M17]|uniref:T9SS type A sorting domain-containing protein n=1 Tax=Mangrovivirga halotolerans TaxID=2993936 RepID=A0ABT3RPU8_9BACT|nr:T9SS type A sorting domain-containing protein [Mangrovivirga halotolerans]MCX2743511.1 T9SS type A sorting domain-containing protein [Mangrovivirga halotolerans]
MNLFFSRTFILLIVLYLSQLSIVNAQQLNAFAAVTSLSGNTVSISDVDETFDSFEVGEKILIMQMQDDVIGETGNNSNFGDMVNIKSAGLFEMVEITSINEVSGTPNSIEVDNISNAFNICSNCSVQIISFPDLGTNYSTTADITSKGWDGKTGGVVAVRVSGVLTLNHDIIMDGKGFRGGSRDNNSVSGSCDDSQFYSSSDDRYSGKGEGIYKIDNNNYLYGRGKILNGGGGGNEHNGGGGGGGNLNTGGDGGAGWNCSSASSGGIGGLGLSSYISSNRIFLGGGGGAGEGNNYVNTDGGNGGGIIILQAQTLKTVGNERRLISANGITASDAGNDGAGGGGAAGSILMDVNTYNILGASGADITANGGNGGNVNHTNAHGGGGGGSQGVIMYSAAHPPEIISETLVGLAGCDNYSCSTTAFNADGNNYDGIMVGAGSPLPVELIYFEAIPLHSELKVKLNWATATELNNEKFIVERSLNGSSWVPVTEVGGAGNSNEILYYSTTDNDPVTGRAYYRLMQIDFNGEFEYSQLVSVDFHPNHHPVIFPNPAETNAFIRLGNDQEINRIQLISSTGSIVTPQIMTNNGTHSFSVRQFAAGVYSLIIHTREEKIIRKLVIK